MIGSPSVPHKMPTFATKAARLNSHTPPPTASKSTARDTVNFEGHKGKEKATEQIEEIISPGVQASRAQDRVENILSLAKGNVGAVSVLQKLDGSGVEGKQAIQALQDLDITGGAIWIGFKDHCRQNLDTFKTKLINRDQDMLAEIESARAKGWC